MPEIQSKNRAWDSGIRVGRSDTSDLAGLRTMAQNHPREFFQRSQELIRSGELTWQRIANLKGLFDALHDVKIEHTVPLMGKQRAITSSAFPLLSGELMIAGIQRAYNTVPTISQELVEDFSDNHRFTHIGGLKVHAPGDLLDGRNQVEELEKFPEITASDRRWLIQNFRVGFMIKISAEMIEENQISDIVERVNKCGTLLGRVLEMRSVLKVYDYYGSRASPGAPYVLMPEGVGAALYTTSTTAFSDCPSGTQVNNNALVDSTDLDNARNVLLKMRDPMLPQTGANIMWPWEQLTVIAPDALVSTFDKITKSPLEPGVVNEHNTWGPSGRYRAKLVSSPLIDSFTTSCWLMGFPKMIFRRKIKQQIQNYSLGMEGQLFLERNVAFQARVLADIDVGAVGNVGMVRNLAATTAPGD